MYIRSDKRLCTNITKRVPSPENVKFTPKYYWEDNALKEHLKNNHLRDIWNLLNDDSDCNNGSKIWITLADKALQGAFDYKPIFVGLCEVMNDAAEQKIKNKGKQNIKYSEEFTNFLVILGGFSTRALDLFRQNLEGRCIQSIRYGIIVNSYLLIFIKFCILINLDICGVMMKIVSPIQIFAMKMLRNLNA